MHFETICTKLRTENNASQMKSFLPDTHSEPFAAQLRFLDEWKYPVVLNAPTHRSIAFRSGNAPRCSKLNFRRKRRWTVTTESLFLKKNCSTANTRSCTFQCIMDTKTALSELSAGSYPTSWTPPLPSNSHLKNMRFLCSTLYMTTRATFRSWIYTKLTPAKDNISIP